MHLYRTGVYGGKNCAGLWHREISNYLQSLGFISLVNLESVFLYQQGTEVLIVGLYVDDAECFFNSSHLAQWFQDKMKKDFNVKFLGRVRWFLGQEIIYDDEKDTTTLSLRTYIESVAKKFGLDGTRKPTTPMEEDIPSSEKTETEEDIRFMKKAPYLELLGCLGWVRQNVGPQYGVHFHKLAAVASHPAPTHWKKLKRVMSTVYHERHLGLTIHGHRSTRVRDEDVPVLEHTKASDVYITFDANHGSKESSYTHVCSQLYLCKVCIADVSKVIKLSATSTAEAEMCAMYEACKQAVFIKKVLEELRLPIDTVPIYGDNQAANTIARQDHPCRFYPRPGTQTNR